MQGIFVSIEGIDASGKTEVSQRVSQYLKNKGYGAIAINKKNTDFYNPYLAKFMSNISKSLWGSVKDDPVDQVSEEAWLYTHALWYKNMEEHLITPLLETNQFVIIDGWYYKFLARHLVNVDFDFDFSYSIISRFIDGDYVFFFDASPEVCWERRLDFKPSELGEHSGIKEGDPFTRFVSYQNKVRNRYLDFSRKPNWHTIHTSNMSIEDIVESIACKLLESF